MLFKIIPKFKLRTVGKFYLFNIKILLKNYAAVAASHYKK